MVNPGPAARSAKAAQNKDQKRCCCANLRRGYAEGTSDQFVLHRGGIQGGYYGEPTNLRWIPCIPRTLCGLFQTL